MIRTQKTYLEQDKVRHLFEKYDLNKNGVLVNKGKLLISNDALVAITLLIAESKPEEMDIIVKIVTNLLSK